MAKRGRPKHTYEVRYTEPPEVSPVDSGLSPWTESCAVRAQGDLEWAARAMCYSVSYLRLLLSANRSSAEITNSIVFRNCRVVAKMRRIA